MKIRSILLGAAALCVGGTFAHAAQQIVVADHPVLWSVHFDAERLRTGAGAEFFTRLEPALNALSGGKATAAGGKLQSLAIFGFEPKKDGNRFPFVADLRLSGEDGGVSRRFDAVSKKRDVPIEDVAGYPTLHFLHEGKEVWIAKVSDSRVFLSTSRPLLEQALAAGPDSFAAAAAARPDEMLGGNVDIAFLLAAHPNLRDSELLKLLPHLDFHLRSTDNGALNLDASAELDSERSARRAARMVDGMVAGLAMHDPNGVPWDERVSLKQDGARLALNVHLNPEEAKKVVDHLSHEIDHKKAPRADKHDKDDKDDE